MNAEQKFKEVVNNLIDNDIYPGPTAINKLYRGQQRNNHLNGRETRWRREVMLQRGVALKRPFADLPLTDNDTEDHYGL